MFPFQQALAENDDVTFLSLGADSNTLNCVCLHAIMTAISGKVQSTVHTKPYSKLILGPSLPETLMNI